MTYSKTDNWKKIHFQVIERFGRHIPSSANRGVDVVKVESIMNRSSSSHWKKQGLYFATHRGTADYMRLRLGLSWWMYTVPRIGKSIWSDEAMIVKLVLLKVWLSCVAWLRGTEKLRVVKGCLVLLDMPKC